MFRIAGVTVFVAVAFAWAGGLAAQEPVDPPVFDLTPLIPDTTDTGPGETDPAGIEPTEAPPSTEAAPAVEVDDDYWERLIWTLPGFWSDPEVYSTTMLPRYTDRQLNDFLIRAKLAKDLEELGAKVNWRKHTYMQLERLARELRIRKDLAAAGVELP